MAIVLQVEYSSLIVRWCVMWCNPGLGVYQGLCQDVIVKSYTCYCKYKCGVYFSGQV